MPSGLGGGVIIAFAAVLWLVYLAPSWLKRRQYLRTERTAVRLQQTLRVLAETAEVPDEVRAEVSARSVAEQHGALRESARRAEAVARPSSQRAERQLARSGRGPRAPRNRARAASAIVETRQRRSRVLAANVLVAGITLGGWGLTDVASGGTAVFLVAGVVVALAAIALLQRASTVAAAHRAVDAVDRAVVATTPAQSFTDWQAGAPERPVWTPVPLPRPLYLDRDDAPVVQRDDRATASSLHSAAARADEALRAAHAAPEVAALHGDETPDLAESGPVLTDLDGVLLRRRTA